MKGIGLCRAEISVQIRQEFAEFARRIGDQANDGTAKSSVLRLVLLHA